MTKEQKATSWLEYRSQVTGKTVEELRQEMREKGSLADKKKGGFAALTPEKRREIASKGYYAGMGKKRKKDV